MIAAAAGIFIAGFSSILTGLNFIVTIHRMRAPGLTWFRLPLFVWSHYATSLIFILGTPVLAIDQRREIFTVASDIFHESQPNPLAIPPAHVVRFLLLEGKREKKVMATVHSKRYHQVNRAVFNSASTAAGLGFIAVLLELVEPQIGALVGFIGVMTAYFAGLNLVCEKTCDSE